MWGLVQAGSGGGMSGSYGNVDNSGTSSIENSHGWAIEEPDDILAEFKKGFESDWGWDSKSAPGKSTNYDNHNNRDDEESDLTNWEPPSPSSVIPKRSHGGNGPRPWKSVLPDDYVSELPATGTASTYGGDQVYGIGGEHQAPAEEPEWGIKAMLVSMGIDAKGTLGWDDAEGDFVDK